MITLYLNYSNYKIETVHVLINGRKRHVVQSCRTIIINFERRKYFYWLSKGLLLFHQLTVA